MHWTDERIELLKKLWSEGLSATQIATQLGGVSRNAIIGKVHRLKLAGRPKGSFKPGPPEKPKTSPSRPETKATTEKFAPPKKPEPPPIKKVEFRLETKMVVPFNRSVPLVELTERICKWPSGDPLTEDFGFCGQETEDDVPYCLYHSRLAYQPLALRKKRR